MSAKIYGIIFKKIRYTKGTIDTTRHGTAQHDNGTYACNVSIPLHTRTQL